MRVVLDTNVLARAARGGTGPAAELLGIIALPPHMLILSPFILIQVLTDIDLLRRLRPPASPPTP
jgi:hypothetical protein